MSSATSILSHWDREGRNILGNYIIGDTVGQGTFGKVKKARHLLLDTLVAVKIVDKIYAPAVEREIETWRYLHHPNIAKLYEVIVTDDKIYMFTELCGGGEAFDYIVNHKRLDDTADSTKMLVWEIVDAIAYCHKYGFVHRDLKLENVLLTDDMHVKIIDFGFTKRYHKNKFLDTFCGSMAYAAPEIVGGEKYVGPFADVWSLGIILYTLVVGYLPFDDDNEAITQQKILSIDFEIPDFLSTDCRDLISKILRLNGSDRISITDIALHPWFEGITGSSNNNKNNSSPSNDSSESASISSSIIHSESKLASLSISDQTPPTVMVSPVDTTTFVAPSAKSSSFSINAPSSTAPTSSSIIGSIRREKALLNLLNEMGFNVEAIIESVMSRMCDSLSATWWLLLEKSKNKSSNDDDDSDCLPALFGTISANSLAPTYSSSNLSSAPPGESSTSQLLKLSVEEMLSRSAGNLLEVSSSAAAANNTRPSITLTTDFRPSTTSYYSYSSSNHKRSSSTGTSSSMRKALGTGSGVGAGRGANSSSLYNTNSDASSSEYSQGSVTQAQYLRPVSAHATSSVYSRRSSDGAVRYGGALLAGGGGGTKGISPRGSFNALAGSTSQNMVVEEEEDEEGDNDD